MEKLLILINGTNSLQVIQLSQLSYTRRNSHQSQIGFKGSLRDLLIDHCMESASKAYSRSEHPICIYVHEEPSLHVNSK